MPNQIFKYEIPLKNNSQITLPSGARILHLDVQDERPYIWAVVDTDALVCDRGVSVQITGGLEPSGEYVGTFLLGHGTFVGHVYMEPEPLAQFHYKAPTSLVSGVAV